MHCSIPLFAAFGASCALALPAQVQPRAHSDEPSSHGAWNEGAIHDFVIHPSCNASETIQLRKGLADAVALADHAVQHILRYGNSSEHYRKYFGNAPSGEAIGYFDKIIHGDKGNALFRCDNPDGNCNQPESELNTYFGTDLLHRLYHIPAFGDNHVEHFAEGYAGALELARTNETYTTRDSDTLQYFAVDVYAFDIILPGVGCTGMESEAANSSMTTSASTSYQSPAANAAGTPTSTIAGAADSATDAAQVG
ncbi:MAG: hypothetical protein Q9208_008013 [Pyrenodesmia sp. 3 TL-2023]